VVEEVEEVEGEEGGGGDPLRRSYREFGDKVLKVLKVWGGVG
jgi:hypothetical protein